MKNIFANRINDVPKSFIREILKVAINKEVISFAGGLPNRQLFPVSELHDATNMIFSSGATDAFQYSNTEGLMELRQYIAKRYRQKQNIDVKPENILITSGSQQGLDLLAKIFVNEGDNVVMEKPGYIGAIQLFSVFKANFLPVTLHSNGLDLNELADVMKKYEPKLIYTVPNFQNPSGVSYSEDNRKEITNILQNSNTYLIEDNPYGELRYSGTDAPSFFKLLPENTILLGSFSKITVPGFRIGWIVAPDYIMEKLIIAKQASDLHTNIFLQKVLFNYLSHYNIDNHIAKIKDVYGKQCQAMIQSIGKYFPKDIVDFTQPEGGMFLWVTLPERVTAMNLFNKAIERNVAFVPGDPFYTDLKKPANTLRLNFSCVDEETIDRGIKILGEVIKDMI